MTGLFKYSGAGNDFIAAAGTAPDSGGLFLPSQDDVRLLCDRRSGWRSPDGRVGADGMIVVSPSHDCDFHMDFYNPDGSSGMMCGNGGRCAVDFAAFLGMIPSGCTSCTFSAADGLHRASIVSREGMRSVIRLGMIDPFGMKRILGGVFLNTGTRHFVRFVDDTDLVDVEAEGALLRHAEEFAPEGVNVNFVQICPDGSIRLRTFEKGVEAETLACGTGIVASAVASFYHSNGTSCADVHTVVHARVDDLTVDFVPCPDPFAAVAAKNIFLTGPVERF